MISLCTLETTNKTEQDSNRNGKLQAQASSSDDDPSWKEIKSQTLWNKQVNTVNEINQMDLNKQPSLLLLPPPPPRHKNLHAIRNSCRSLCGDMRHLSAEKQHLIRAVTQHIPHHDTHSNSAWGRTPPEPGSLSQQHNRTGMRTNNRLLPSISFQHTHTK